MGKRLPRSTRGRERSFRRAILSGLRQVGGRVARSRARVGVLRPGAAARRVVVKAHVVQMSAGGAKASALHLRYIARDGVEKDGSKGNLYTADGDVRLEAFEQPRPNEKHQFRLIVSPEDAAELDLAAYVRNLMARVERDLGRRLEWAAVNHFDTEHPHAHLVIRGVDRDGEEVRLDRQYISQGLRWRAQEIATQELGPRSEIEIRRAREREVSHVRLTSLDRELERRTADGCVAIPSAGRLRSARDSLLIARLEHLAVLRLAERRSATEWSLTPGWTGTLREWGASGDILKQIHASIAGDSSRYHILRRGQPLDTGDPTGASTLFGRVASKGLSDELKGRYYAVVETPTGHGYHVPLDARAFEALRSGDIVTLTSRPEPAVRPIDRTIVATAGREGGQCDLGTIGADSALASSLERRLHDLERARLVARISSTGWLVPSDLLERLERRAAESPPKHQLSIRRQALSLEDQARYLGPVVLDDIDPRSLAPSRFGAAVRRAIAERRDMLRQFGLANTRRDRPAALRELERRAIGSEIAVRLGRTLLTTPTEGMQGRIRLHVAPSGNGYAVIDDGARIAVLRSTPRIRTLPGKVVSLSRNTAGRLVILEQGHRDLGR